MASYPTYDPSEFIGGISTQAYKALTSTGNHEPLFNKAISGSYAPGSTWKLFSADAGLENGQITPSTSLYDPGYYEVPDCETAPARSAASTASSARRSADGQPLVGHHQVERRLLLQARRRHVAPAGPARRRRAGPHLPEVGLRRRHRPRPGRRGRRTGPRPEVAAVVRRGAVRGQPGQDRGLRHLALRHQPQHGDRPGRRAGHAAAAGQRLRHLRQRRHALPAPARAPGGEVRERGRCSR